jgi:hypothetical protein
MNQWMSPAATMSTAQAADGGGGWTVRSVQLHGAFRAIAPRVPCNWRIDAIERR